MKVPPRYPYVCQPAEVAWNHPYESRLRRRWLDCLRAQIAQNHPHGCRQALERQRLSGQVAGIAGDEIQEVVREKFSSIQEQMPNSAFEMVVPKRTDITPGIA